MGELIGELLSAVGELIFGGRDERRERKKRRRKGRNGENADQ